LVLVSNTLLFSVFWLHLSFIYRLKRTKIQYLIVFVVVNRFSCLFFLLQTSLVLIIYNFLIEVLNFLQLKEKQIDKTICEKEKGLSKRSECIKRESGVDTAMGTHLIEASGADRSVTEKRPLAHLPPPFAFPSPASKPMLHPAPKSRKTRASTRSLRPNSPLVAKAEPLARSASPYLFATSPTPSPLTPSLERSSSSLRRMLLDPSCRAHYRLQSGNRAGVPFRATASLSNVSAKLLCSYAVYCFIFTQSEAWEEVQEAKDRLHFMKKYIHSF